jgi:hypothetical protein
MWFQSALNYSRASVYDKWLRFILLLKLNVHDSIYTGRRAGKTLRGASFI